MCFAGMNFSARLASQALPSMWFCSEKSILAKQINDSIYIYMLVRTSYIQRDDDDISFLLDQNA